MDQKNTELTLFSTASFGFTVLFISFLTHPKIKCAASQHRLVRHFLLCCCSSHCNESRTRIMLTLDVWSNQNQTRSEHISLVFRFGYRRKCWLYCYGILCFTIRQTDWKLYKPLCGLSFDRFFFHETRHQTMWHSASFGRDHLAYVKQLLFSWVFQYPSIRPTENLEKAISQKTHKKPFHEQKTQKKAIQANSLRVTRELKYSKSSCIVLSIVFLVVLNLFPINTHAHKAHRVRIWLFLLLTWVLFILFEKYQYNLFMSSLGVSSFVCKQRPFKLVCYVQPNVYDISLRIFCLWTCYFHHHASFAEWLYFPLENSFFRNTLLMESVQIDETQLSTTIVSGEWTTLFSSMRDSSMAFVGPPHPTGADMK